MHRGGGGSSPFSLPHSGVPVLLLSSGIFLTLSRRPPPVPGAYTVGAPISVCAGNYWGRACGGTCTARGEAAAAAATAATAATTSGQSLVSRPSEQQAPREARRASERSPLCARGQWARVGARRSTEYECGPRACFIVATVKPSLAAPHRSCLAVIAFRCSS